MTADWNSVNLSVANRKLCVFKLLLKTIPNCRIPATCDFLSLDLHVGLFWLQTSGSRLVLMGPTMESRSVIIAEV